MPQADGQGLKDTALRIFQGLAREYDRTVDYATLFQDRRWKQWAGRQIPARPGNMVLDVGCGTLLMEERMLGSGCLFVGIDLTQEMIRGGQSKKVPNVGLLVNGDAESLPFHDATFDSVVSCYVPKYVAVWNFAREVARITKPGGVAVLYDFAKPRGPLAPLLEAYIQAGLRVVGFLLGLARRREAFTFNELPEIVEQTTWDSEVSSAMEQAGFETLATERLTRGVVFGYSGRMRK